MDVANEQAIQANRDTMVDLAWRHAFCKSIEPEQQRVHRVWTQVRAKYGRVTTGPMVAALTLEFSCCPPKARGHLARTVDCKLLLQSLDPHDSRVKIFTVPAEAQEAISKVFRLIPVIDQVVLLQRAAMLNDFEAGSDLLPAEVYIDKRSKEAERLLKTKIDKKMEEISKMKKGVV